MEHIPEPESRTPLAARSWVRWLFFGVLTVIVWASVYVAYGQDIFLAWFIQINVLWGFILLVLVYCSRKKGRTGPLSTTQTP